MWKLWIAEIKWTWLQLMCYALVKESGVCNFGYAERDLER